MAAAINEQRMRGVTVPVVASERLDRAHVPGLKDKSVGWAGAFATCGGQSAVQSSTIVYEIEPGGHLGWHTDATEETRYTIAGSSELRMANAPSDRAACSCCPRTCATTSPTPARRRCAVAFFCRRDVHAKFRRSDAAAENPHPRHAQSERLKPRGASRLKLRAFRNGLLY